MKEFQSHCGRCEVNEVLQFEATLSSAYATWRQALGSFLLCSCFSLLGCWGQPSVKTEEPQRAKGKLTELSQRPRIHFQVSSCNFHSLLHGCLLLMRSRVSVQNLGRSRSLRFTCWYCGSRAESGQPESLEPGLVRGLRQPVCGAQGTHLPETGSAFPCVTCSLCGSADAVTHCLTCPAAQGPHTSWPERTSRRKKLLFCPEQPGQALSISALPSRWWLSRAVPIPPAG